MRRDGARRSPCARPPPSRTPPPAPARRRPSSRCSPAERHGALVAALDRLDDRDREVIACRYLLELTEAETAAALGCRAGTVKSRLSRALDRLRAQAGTEALHA